MSSALLLAAVISGSLDALVLLAALVCDIRGPKKRTGDWGGDAERPKAA